MGKFLLSAFADESSKDLLEQVEALKRNNMRFLEIRNVGPKGAMFYTLEEIEGFAKTLSDNGIQVNSIGSGIGKISITDDFEPHFEFFKKHIEAAKIFNTKYIRIFSYYIPEGDDPYKYSDEVMRRMQAVSEYAYENGVYCCHENETGIYGESAERCVEMLEKCPNLKGIFDPANFITNKLDIPHSWNLLKGKIEYMHIKDAIYETKQVVPAGEGDGCIAQILKEFALEEGDRFLTLEPHLTVFDGLKDLQKEELKHKYTFNSKPEAFDIAVKSLKNILDAEGLDYE